MFIKSLKDWIGRSVHQLQSYVDQAWYPPLIGILALIDNIVVVIPNDGILISSSMLAPKRWFNLALWVSIGSTLGALLLIVIIEKQGLPWILQLYPDIDKNQIWQWTHSFFENYGLLVVFVVAISPLAQQPAVILAGLAQTPIFELCLIIFTGRLIKFLIMAYVGSHAPRLLNKLWGLKGELKEVGMKIES